MKPEKYFQTRVVLVFFLTLFFLAGCVQNFLPPTANESEVSCISKGWPHDKSDLNPDPALQFGTLDNGFRFVIMHNEEPKDRVGLYLDIQSGSLEEKDNQRGYAHFLEHMMFNGTAHYPPGTLVEYFQSIGMSFGADTNAHTAFDETVYRLLLPDGSEKNLHDGLEVMADYARGALILEKEVERERGIILAEKRTRDSAGYRLWEKRTGFSFAGTRAARRFPIGTEETLRNADAATLRDFYDSWYRPENMILVVVGDVDMDLAKKMIQERFAALAAPAKKVECFDFGAVVEEGEHYLYVHEPEIGSTEISISSNWNASPENDSASAQHVEMKKYIAALLFRNRMQQLVREPGSPLTSSFTYSGAFQERVEYITVGARVEGENWQNGLELLEVTLRQALEKGFTERELKRVQKEILADLKKEVQTAASRDSRKLASHIINALNRNDVFLSPEQELELYGPVVESLDIDEANAIFQQLWSRNNRKIIVAGTADVTGAGNSKEIIRSVYKLAKQKKLPEWRENGEIAFPYLPVPEKEYTVAGSEYFEAIGLERHTFTNGTVLNIKKTSFKPNEVSVEVHFGPGKLSEKDQGLSMLARAVVNESGVGRLTKTELEEALAGYNVHVSFNVGRESFFLKGGGLSNEFDLLLQLFRAKLLDPAFRVDAYRLSMERFAQQYEEMSSTVDGMMRLRGEQFLAGNSPRYGMAPFDKVQKLTIDKVREWLLPYFTGASLEISVVGDVEPDKVVQMVGQYFGTISRPYSKEIEQGFVAFPTDDKLHDSVVSQVDKALVVIAWSTDDFWDISRTRRLGILSEVFSDRLRLEIREKLGAVYSPRVYNYSSKVEPGYGVLRVMLTVDPNQSEAVAEKVREVAAKLAREGSTQEELKRSLEPVLTSIKDLKQTNRYWMESVISLSSRHPQQLEWPLTIQSDFASISAKEISEFAARYLKPEHSAEIIFTPVAP